jgi:hypothetical protein
MITGINPSDGDQQTGRGEFKRNKQNHKPESKTEELKHEGFQCVVPLDIWLSNLKQKN